MPFSRSMGRAFHWKKNIMPEPMNHRNLSELTNQLLVKNNLTRNVKFFLTDNTAYCRKTYSDIFSVMYPNMIWIGCWAHIIVLVGETWQNHFVLSKKILSNMRLFFKKKVAAGRKRRWYSHQLENGSGSPSHPPKTSFARWTSWMRATTHHGKKIDLYRDFIEKEVSLSESSFNMELKSQLEGDLFIQLNSELSFISEYGCQMIRLIDFLESKNTPIAHEIYDCLMDFAGALQSGRSALSFSPNIEHLLAEYKLPNKKLADILILFQDGFSRASQKLMKHDIQQKNLDFFKAARIFDARKRASLTRNIFCYSKIPGMDNPSDELLSKWSSYQNGDFQFDSFDICKFWNLKKDTMPTLSNIALPVIWVPASAAVVERSFSFKNLVENMWRTNLSNKSLKGHLYFYYNNKFIEFWSKIFQKQKKADSFLGGNRISLLGQQTFAVSGANMYSIVLLIAWTSVVYQVWIE